MTAKKQTVVKLEGESRVMKARIIGGPELGQSTEYPSKQLLSDPFEGLVGVGEGVTTSPPYSMEQLVILSESHPVHAAALEQKSMDAIGAGPTWVPLDDSADEGQRDEIRKWLDSLPEQETFAELLHSGQSDYETVGWGTLEVARGADGKVKHLWHVPGHTVRAHRDNMRFVQALQGKAVWFKRWGIGLEETPILVVNGRKAPEKTDWAKQANEMLILKKSSRRSTWYGIPNYVAAIGHIALAIAARDYNVKFFSNSREPRLVFVVSALDRKDADEYLDELEQSLRTQHNEPHRNLILPATGKTTIKIERITALQNDMQFVRLMEQTERAILAAHRVPPDRVGVITRGFLGGNVSASINRVYKDAVVGPSQLILEDRLNRFIKAEFAREKGIKDPEAIRWRLEFESVDLTDESVDTANTIAKVKANMITLNEGREVFGMPPGDDMDVTLAEWLSKHGGGGGGVAMAAAGGADFDLRMDAMSRTQESIMIRMEQLDEVASELLLGVESEGSDEREDE